MSSASSTPDISSLSLSHKPSQQRLHENYDYEGNISGNGRPQYHYSTSPPIPAQSQYNPLTLNQSPLKNKTVRGGLPSVCVLIFLRSPAIALYLLFMSSNGLIIPLLLQTTVHFRPTIIRIYLLLEVPHLCLTSIRQWLRRLRPLSVTTRLYPLQLS
jgi:hypothetical protein